MHVLIMSHNAAGVSRVQNPSKRLGEIITGVNNPRNKGQCYITSFFPILHSEVLNIYVAGSFGGDHKHSFETVFRAELRHVVEALACRQKIVHAPPFQ